MALDGLPRGVAPRRRLRLRRGAGRDLPDRPARSTRGRRALPGRARPGRRAARCARTRARHRVLAHAERPRARRALRRRGVGAVEGARSGRTACGARRAGVPTRRSAARRHRRPRDRAQQRGRAPSRRHTGRSSRATSSSAATSGSLRLCPASWLPDGVGQEELRASLEPLVALRVEHVLVSHGRPVLGNGAAALRSLLRP